MMTDAAVRFARLPLTVAERARAFELASASEVERYRRKPSDTFLLGRLLLRELVAELTGVAANITAACAQCGEEHGQPRDAGLFLSVAHADDIAIVAAAARPVGVDIEKESAAVPPEFARGVREWTQLEAVLKAAAGGFDIDPTSVTIRNGSARHAGVRYTLENIETVPGYVSSVALAAPALLARRRANRRGVAR